MPKSKTHVKPTKEELEEIQKVAIEASEEPKEEVDEAPEETPDEIDDEEIKEVEEPEEPPKVDLKKKLSASARENQKILAKNRTMTKALADAEEMPEPTEEELVKEFKDWEMMSDLEKTLAKETVVSRNWRKTIAQAKETATKIEKWNESVDEFVVDPKTLVDNPALEGKTTEFMAFAKTEANNSVPMSILISAFLHERSAGKTPNKGKMFEKGSGGDKKGMTPKSDKISLTQARKIRETDYSKWRELVKAGKIEIDV